MRGSMGIVSSAANYTPFVPTSISGCQLWFDADDATTFSFSSGAVVSEWRDKSGNARHLTPVSTAPTRVSAAINGRAAVDFNATYMKTPVGTIYTLFQPFSLYIVATTDIPNTSSRNRLFGARDSTNCQFIYSTNTDKTLVAYNGAAFVTAPANAISNTTQHVSTAAMTGSSSVLYVDGSPGSVVNPGTSGIALACVGAIWDGSQSHDGKICEIIVYNSILAEDLRQNVELYLKWKWATPYLRL